MPVHSTYRELHRSRSDRMLGGVCGGLGQYFGVNPVFYRVGFVILTLLGGAGLLVYGAAVIVIPDEGERESIASDILRNHRQRPVALVGLGLVLVAGIALLSRISWHFHSGTVWVIVLLVGASLLWAQRKRPHGSTPAEAPTVTTPVTGVAPVPAARRGSGLRALRITAATIGVLIVLGVAAAIAAVAPHLHLRDGIGTRSYEPAALSSLRPEYRLGVGKLVLDLSNLNLAKRSPRTAIDARLGIGHLVIRVPRGVTVTARSRVVWGDSHLLGHDESGHDLTVDVGAARGQLVLDTHVGIGQVDVERAGP